MYGFLSKGFVLPFSIRVLWTKPVLPMSVQMSVCLSHRFFNLSFVMTCIVVSVSLIFLWQLALENDVINVCTC